MSITLPLHSTSVKEKSEQKFDKGARGVYGSRAMKEKRSSEVLHPIQVVSRRTGLSADVIRVWERRYGAVEPTRAGNRRRLYTDEEVQRLLLLRRATMAGRRIGEVAGLSLEELRDLVRSDEVAEARSPKLQAVKGGEGSTSGHLRACLEAVERLDSAGLEAELSLAGNELSAPVLMEAVLQPLMEAVGHRWEAGTLSISHEHLATTAVREVLQALRSAHAKPFAGPNIVICTPSGQMHEIGALMAAVTAASEGWRVTYLGVDLPVPDIAEAATQCSAAAVALSVSYGNGSLEEILDRIRQLRGILPDGTALLVGGRASEEIENSLSSAGAIYIPDLTSLRSELVAVKTRAAGF